MIQPVNDQYQMTFVHPQHILLCPIPLPLGWSLRCLFLHTYSMVLLLGPMTIYVRVMGSLMRKYYFPRHPRIPVSIHIHINVLILSYLSSHYHIETGLVHGFQFLSFMRFYLALHYNKSTCCFKHKHFILKLYQKKVCTLHSVGVRPQG